MPDASELNALSLSEWKTWFTTAAELVLNACPDDGVAIFYQTDIKKEGTWIDKGYLCQKAAEQTGHALLWHRIVCRAPSGTITFGRPAYSHFLCFSKKVRPDLSKSSADVIPQAGETTWTRGMGVQACLAACRYVMQNTSTRTIVDPFCGHGTVLAAANSMGLSAIGVELGPKRARRARVLRVTAEGVLDDSAQTGPIDA
jgi:hypothetical protein